MQPVMPPNHDHATQTCHTIEPPSFYSNKSCFPTSIMLFKHVMLPNHRHVMQPIMLPDHHHATQTSHAIPPPTCHQAICDLWVTNCRCLEGMLPVIGWSAVPTSRSLARRMRLSVSWREWRYVRYLCVGLLSCCHCADWRACCGSCRYFIWIVTTRVCVCVCVCMRVYVHVYTKNVCMSGVCLRVYSCCIFDLFSHTSAIHGAVFPQLLGLPPFVEWGDKLWSVLQINMLLCRHSTSVKVVAQGYLWPKWDRTATTEGARSLPQALLTSALMLTLDHFSPWVLFSGTSNDCVYTRCKIKSD